MYVGLQRSLLLIFFNVALAWNLAVKKTGTDEDLEIVYYENFLVFLIPEHPQF